MGLYKNEQYPQLLISISVLLDDFDGKNEIKEPLISAAIFDYSPKDEIDNWDYWYSRLHLSSPTRRDDGEFEAYDPNKRLDEKNKHPVNTIHSLAIPLVEIKHSKCLNDKVILKIKTEITNLLQ